jgi:hypothetical protein
MSGMFERFSRAAVVPVARVAGPPRDVLLGQLPAQIVPGTATVDAPVNMPQRSQPRLDPAHVTRLVAQADAIPQKTRSGGNVDGYLHLSSLIGICEREQAISQQHAVPSFSSVSGPMKIIWALGRAVEKHIRNSVIVARQWKLIYGKWHCRCRASSHLGEFPEHRTCPRCDGLLSIYAEPLLVSHEHGVIGSPDLTLIELGWFLATEIKSMNKEQFDALERPLADHILQACGYRHLYKLMGFPVLDVVHVVYARKDFKFGGSRAVYKEYPIQAAAWQGQVDAMFAAAARVKASREHGVLPERTCRATDCARAKECTRMNLCFSL